MASCEKCWNDAYELQSCEENHHETYNRLIKEREDKPFTEKEQKIMKKEIKKILYKFLQDGISSDDAAQQVLFITKKYNTLNDY